MVVGYASHADVVRFDDHGGMFNEGEEQLRPTYYVGGSGICFEV